MKPIDFLIIVFILVVVFLFAFGIYHIVKTENEYKDFCKQQEGLYTNSKCVFVDEESRFVESFKIKKVEGRYYLSK